MNVEATLSAFQAGMSLGVVIGLSVAGAVVWCWVRMRNR